MLWVIKLRARDNLLSNLRMTLLPIISVCDNFRPQNSSGSLTTFYAHVPPAKGSSILGYLKPIVVEQLHIYNNLLQQKGESAIWDLIVTDGQSQVGFSAHLNTKELRSQAMETMYLKWRDDGTPFGDTIAGRLWRNEIYHIYENLLVPSGSVVFDMERAASPLFGVVTYGVHMTLYTEDYRVWVPRRAKTKQT